MPVRRRLAAEAADTAPDIAADIAEDAAMTNATTAAIALQQALATRASLLERRAAALAAQAAAEAQERAAAAAAGDAALRGDAEAAHEAERRAGELHKVSVSHRLIAQACDRNLVSIDQSLPAVIEDARRAMRAAAAGAFARSEASFRSAVSRAVLAMRQGVAIAHVSGLPDAAAAIVTEVPATFGPGAPMIRAGDGPAELPEGSEPLLALADAIRSAERTAQAMAEPSAVAA
jgi:hypothetical protein